MAKFYRLANADNHGPYHSDHSASFNRSGDEDHPSPNQDPVLREKWERLRRSSSYKFGFRSLEQLLDWFSYKDRLSLADVGFRIRIYENLPIVYHGEKQSIAKLDSIQPIRILHPVTLESRATAISTTNYQSTAP